LRVQLRQPAAIALALALVVVVGALIYIGKMHAEDFDGKETIESIIHAESVATEPISPVEAGQLDDWFLLKGFEGYSVPPPVDKLRAIGGRVWNHGRIPVAEVTLEQGARLLVMRTTSIRRGNWSAYQQGKWIVAVWSDRETACILLWERSNAQNMPCLLP